MNTNLYVADLLENYVRMLRAGLCTVAAFDNSATTNQQHVPSSKASYRQYGAPVIESSILSKLNITFNVTADTTPIPTLVQKPLEFPPQEYTGQKAASKFKFNLTTNPFHAKYVTIGGIRTVDTPIIERVVQLLGGTIRPAHEYYDVLVHVKSFGMSPRQELRPGADVFDWDRLEWLASAKEDQYQLNHGINAVRRGELVEFDWDVPHCTQMPWGDTPDSTKHQLTNNSGINLTGKVVGIETDTFKLNSYAAGLVLRKFVQENGGVEEDNIHGEMYNADYLFIDHKVATATRVANILHYRNPKTQIVTVSCDYVDGTYAVTIHPIVSTAEWMERLKALVRKESVFNGKSVAILGKFASGYKNTQSLAVSNIRNAKLVVEFMGGSVHNSESQTPPDYLFTEYVVSSTSTKENVLAGHSSWENIPNVSVTSFNRRVGVDWLSFEAAVGYAEIYAKLIATQVV